VSLRSQRRGSAHATIARVRALAIKRQHRRLETCYVCDFAILRLSRFWQRIDPPLCAAVTARETPKSPSKLYICITRSATTPETYAE
jgi:hypothetical protein